MIEAILGPELVALAYAGLVLAIVGVSICLFIIFPQQIKEAKKDDGIRATRISLPILVSVIIAVFTYAILSTIDRLFLQNSLGNPQGNIYRMAIGTGIFAVGLCFYIIYRRGGTLSDGE